MRYWFLCLGLFYSALSLGQTQCSATPEQYGLEFIQEELAGRRLQKYHSCLDQKNFRYIKAVHDPGGEISKRPQFIVKKESQKIIGIKIINPKMRQYEVLFQVLASSDQGKTWKEYQDSLEFFMTADQKRGCALLLSSPKATLTSEACR